MNNTRKFSLLSITAHKKTDFFSFIDFLKKITEITVELPFESESELEHQMAKDV